MIARCLIDIRSHWRCNDSRECGRAQLFAAAFSASYPNSFSHQAISSRENFWTVYKDSDAR